MTEIGHASYLDRKRHYIVSRKPNNSTIWTYQIYKNRLDDYVHLRDFCVVVIGDNLASSQRLFAVPIDYLREHILLRADMDYRGRYTFEVNKTTYEFTWRHSLHMDGKPFLVI